MLNKDFFLFCVLPCLLWGNPKGCHLRHGTMKMESIDSNILAVHAQEKTILEWDEFSIAPQELTRFVLPDASSSILNRVIGGNASEIYGSLESNGKVFLINSKGIVFGPDAQIQTASFFASTLDALDLEFLKGDEISFSGNSKEAIVHLGTISASDGDAVLIACHIENKGVIEAKNGLAALAAGTHVFLAPQSNQKVWIRTNVLEEGKRELGIDNQGIIQAQQVEIKADGSLYQFAIKDSGTIDALGMQERGGKLFLVAESGYLEASGSYLVKNDAGIGGEVRFLGKEVFVTEEAYVNASGKNGGGQILIGGDYQGKNEEIPNAEIVSVASNARISADALESGNGGKVILWGDVATGFFGTISSKGGAFGGDGGFIEVSSPGYLVFEGFADRSAVFGNAGTLLLDPCAVTISNMTDSGTTFSMNAYTFSGMTANINAGILGMNLDAGPVTIDATFSGTAVVPSITVSNNVTWSAPNVLTLYAFGAGGQIVMNALINPTNAAMAPTTPIVNVTGGDVIIGDPAHMNINLCGVLAASGKVELDLGSSSLAIYGGMDNGDASGGISGGSVNILNVNGVTLEAGGIGTGGARARIFTQGSGGNDISINNAGDYVITGGFATNTGAQDNAGIYAGLSTGAGNITLSGVNYFLTGGAAAVGNVRAEIFAKGTITITGNGDLSIKANTMVGSINNGAAIYTDALNGHIQCDIGTGNYTLQGGLSSNTGSDNSAVIATGQNTGSNGNIVLNGGAYSIFGGGGGNSSAYIHAVGTIQITGNGDLTMIAGAGSGDQSVRISTGASGGNITCDIGMGNYVIQGNTSGNSQSNNSAGIYTGFNSIGNGNIQLSGAAYTLTAGGGDAMVRSIISAIGTIDITGTSDMTLTGTAGAGELSAMIVTSAVGGDITCDIGSGNYVFQSGLSTNSSSNNSTGIYTGFNSIGDGNIQLSGAAYTLTAGGGGGLTQSSISAIGTIDITGTANMMLTGVGASANGSATITTSATGGDITCNIGGGDYIFQGGTSGNSGSDNRAGIYAGLNRSNAVVGTGNIVIQGGNYDFTGGGGSSVGPTSAQIGAVGTIMLTGTGNVSLNGGVGVTGSATIFTSGLDNGNITAMITGDYLITGGTSSAGAAVAGFATGQVSGSGSISLTGAAYTLTGGASGGGQNRAQIITSSRNTGTNAISLISTTMMDDLELQGGNGSLASALISGYDSVSITGFQDCILTGGGGSSASGSDAIIQATGPSGFVTIGSLGNPLTSVVLNGGTAPNQNSRIQTTAATGSHLITIYADDLTLNGSTTMTATGASSFISGAIGSIDLIVTDAIELHGGAADNAIARISTTNNLTTISLSSDSLLLQGGTGNGAAAEIVSSGGLIKIDWNGAMLGTMELSAGGGDAIIHTIAAAGANPVIQIGQTTPFSSMEMTGGSGSTARAMVSTEAAGDIISTVNGNYTIAGGASSNTVAGSNAGGSSGFYTASAGSDITLSGQAYSLTGGAGTGTNHAVISAFGNVNLDGINLTLTGGSSTLPSGSDAIIESRGPNGNVNIGSVMTPFTTVVLNGGTASNQNSYIQTTSATGSNLITVYADGLTLNGSMTATDASAVILGDVGSIDLSVVNGITLNGGGAMGASASIATTGTTDMISLGSSTLLLQGGSADGAIAEITSAGGLIQINRNAMGAGTLQLLANVADAIIHTTGTPGVTPVIAIGQNSPFLSMTMTGGSGSTARAMVSTDAGGDILSTVNGNYTITGGSSSNTMGGSNAGGSAGFYTASAGSDITLISSGQLYFLTGGAGSGTNHAAISAFGDVNLSGLGLTLTGGSSTLPSGSDAIIESTGPNGNVNIMGFSLVVLNGGSAPSQNSYIQTTATTGTNQITINTNDLILNGSMTATDASAVILGNIGSIALNVSNGITLNGGGAMGASASIATTETTDVISLNSASLLLQGGSADGAIAEITSAGGLIQIDRNNLMLGTIELLADVADAIIHTTGTPGVSPVIAIGTLNAFLSMTMTGGSGDTARAMISTEAGGDILSGVNANYTITGGTSSNTMGGSNAGGSAGFYTASPDGNIALAGQAYSLTGGVGTGINHAAISAFGNVNLSGINLTLTGGGSTLPSGSDAIIESTGPNGNVNIGAVMSPFTTVILNGGTASNQNSYIQTTSATGSKQILIYADDLTLNGSMTATDASAVILGDVGSIDLSVVNGITLNGGGAMGASASIATTGTTDVISLSSSTLLLQGGSADEAIAEITSAGGLIQINRNAMGAGTMQLLADVADAIIHTTGTPTSDVTPVIAIGQNSPFLSMTMTGGSGGTARAMVSTDAGGDIASTVNGNYTIAGGSSSSTAVGSNAGGSAGFYTASAGSDITLSSPGQPYFLTGGAGTGTNHAAISAFGDVNLSGLNLTLTGGSSTLPSGSDAIIESTGPNGNVNMSFSLVVLNGGTAPSQNSYIQTTATTGTNQITINTSDLTLNGSMTATDASAVILGNIGSIALNVSNGITLNGGGAMGASASIATTETTDVISLNSASLLLQGGSADGAIAEITSAGGLIQIDRNNLMLGTIELLADVADAVIHTTGTPGVNPVIAIGTLNAFLSMTMTGGSGDTARAMISTEAGGDILSGVNANYTITGGTSSNAMGGSNAGGSAGFYTASPDGNIALAGQAYSLTGGAGTGTNHAAISAFGDVNLSGLNLTLTGGSSTLPSGSDAIIESTGPNGNVNIGAVMSPFTTVILNGGSAPIQNSYIQTTAMSGSNQITIYADDLTLNGSTTMMATGASSFISGAIGSIDLIVADAIELHGGAADNAIAQISTTNNMTTISLSSDSLLLQGGTGSGAAAEIVSSGGLIEIDWNGAMLGTMELSAGGGDAIIHTTAAPGPNPVIQIGQTTPFSSMTMTGGNGTVARAIVSTDVGGNIFAEVDGDYFITGGTSVNMGDNGSAGFYAGLNSGIGNVNLVGDNYVLLGGAMGSGNNEAAIFASGSVTTSASSNYTLTGGGGDNAPALVTASGTVHMDGVNYNLTGGTGAVTSGANAAIQSTGVGGSVIVHSINQVNLLGGGAGQDALIQTTAMTGPNPVTVFAHQLNVTGGAAMDASAEIVTNQGPIRLVVLGAVNVTGGSVAGADALVHSTGQGNLFVRALHLNAVGGIAGTTTGFTTPSGNINMIYAGHMDYDAAMGGQAVLQTASGNLFVTTLGYIEVAGNTVVSDAGTGGVLRLLAGTNLTIGPSAQVLGNGSSLVLVVDGRYPIPPLHGSGAFYLDMTATLTAAMGTPVRIFTSVRNLNSINTTINGMVFIPSFPVGADTTTERWGVYFPNSYYGGMAFTLFYKFPSAIGPTPPPFVPPGLAAFLNNLPFLLARAAFVDSEMFFNLSRIDDFVFDDAFAFSLFRRCWQECRTGFSPLEWEQRGLSIRKRKGLVYDNNRY